MISFSNIKLFHKNVFVLILVLLIFSCNQPKDEILSPKQLFSSDLVTLKAFFQIPGMAVAIDHKGERIFEQYSGFEDMEQQKLVSNNTVFPIASITKVFSGLMIMKLVEDDRLSLEDPINKYAENSRLGDSILVKHILSHSSQGKVGEHFYYSSRFGYLTAVIEKASGENFESYFKNQIVNPLSLDNTFLLKNKEQPLPKGMAIAKPYILEDGISVGFIDYGYSASAGIVSNLNDLSKLSAALDNNSIISEASKLKMYGPFEKGLPYGFGVFNQEFKDQDVIWAYGQYDCYSSLFLKVPEKDLSLTILANSSLLSDPARLINGDILSSRFALSFLEHYVFSSENGKKPGSNDLEKTDFNRKKLLANALAESYMARYEPKRLDSSAILLRKVFKQYPDYLSYADLNLLHNLSFLKDVTFYMELGEFNEFDTQLEEIGQQLLSEDPNNPYANIYLGTYYARNKETERARYHFKRIVEAENFSKNWYTQEAKDWLMAN